MDIVLASLVALCVILCVDSYLRSLKFREFAEKVGGPRGLPLIGVLHRVLSMRDLLYILPGFTGSNKSAFFWLGRRPVYYTFDPEKLEKILTSPDCINKSEVYDIIEQELPSGLLTSKSPLWEKHRKLLNPCFSHKVLLSFIPIFNQYCDETLEKMDVFVGRGEVDLWNILQRFTLQTSYSTTIGNEYGQSVGENQKLILHVERYIHIVFERTVSILMRNSVTFRLHKEYKEYTESKTTFIEYVRNILMKKLAALNAPSADDTLNNNSQEEESVNITKPKFIFVDCIMQSLQNNVLTWEEACNHSATIVAAAFETSATTLYSALMLLAMHPEYQEKLYEEVLSVFPDKNSDVSFEHFSDLVYMDMILDETLRLAPSVPLISRIVSKKTPIGDDLWIPKDTIIIMDIFNAHRSKALWGPNADSFDPDNFLPKSHSDRHPYAFVPFSKGPRNCIGWRYARIFLKVSLSKIIRNYRISTSFRYADLRYVQHLSLRYEVMPKLEIHRR